MPEVQAVAGLGLEGDRFFAGLSAEGKPVSDPAHEVTLIESEAIAALARERGIELGQGEPRRNLVTRGVALNELVEKEFSIGPVRLRGIRLCEPCGHLESLTAPGVEAGLKHRGGLRAQVLEGGTLRPGDAIVIVTDGAARGATTR